MMKIVLSSILALTLSMSGCVGPSSFFDIACTAQKKLGVRIRNGNWDNDDNCDLCNWNWYC